VDGIGLGVEIVGLTEISQCRKLNTVTHDWRDSAGAKRVMNTLPKKRR
jgi:hypothetical protein